MKIINTFVRLVDRRIVAANRKRSFQSLIRMTDRELEDIGLPRECLYTDSANQKRHLATVSQSRKSVHARSMQTENAA